MALSFDGQVAVVTGAGRGLGRAHAMGLAARGAKVVVNDNGCDVNGNGTDPGVADAVVKEIKDAGGEAIASYDDVGTYDGGYNVIKAAMDAWGRVDVVVCNAGILRDAAFHNMGEEAWDAAINGHLKGCYTVLHAAWPVFRQQHYGRVVMTTSISGTYGNFGQANYAAAKSGIIGLMQTLKLEGEKYNVMVNVLSPAAGTRMGATVPSRGDAAEVTGPTRTPEQVSPVVFYMASEECTDSGLIVHGAGGSFNRISYVRGPSIEHDPDGVADDDWVRDNWSKITSLEWAEPMWNLSTTRADHLKERAAQE